MNDAFFKMNGASFFYSSNQVLQCDKSMGIIICPRIQRDSFFRLVKTWGIIPVVKVWIPRHQKISRFTF